jgi:hypothetical protein
MIECYTTNKKMADIKSQNAGKASPSKGKKKGAKPATDESLGPLLTEKQQGIERHSPAGKFALEWKNINFKVLAQDKGGIINNFTSWFSDEDLITEDQHILKNSCGYVK